MTLLEFLRTKPESIIAVELGDIIGSTIASEFMDLLYDDPEMRKRIEVQLGRSDIQQVLITCCFGMLSEEVDEKKYREIAQNIHLQARLAMAKKMAEEANADAGA